MPYPCIVVDRKYWAVDLLRNEFIERGQSRYLY